MTKESIEKPIENEISFQKLIRIDYPECGRKIIQHITFYKSEIDKDGKG